MFSLYWRRAAAIWVSIKICCNCKRFSLYINSASYGFDDTISLCSSRLVYFEMYSGGGEYICREDTERNDDTESIYDICTSYYLCNCKSLTLRKEDMD